MRNRGSNISACRWATANQELIERERRGGVLSRSLPSYPNNIDRGIEVRWAERATPRHAPHAKGLINTGDCAWADQKH